MFSLWRKARRENSAASRLLGSTSLRFALHGWQRLQDMSTDLYLLPGDVALSSYEDALSNEWPHSMGDSNLYRP
ncbi:hypothetical protein, partial [Thiolapillus sp.]|uniref:hypothetical protein n=1 Tax=Thiolapillus sp. TaxID=2017437 RepID=UPI003AF6C274